MAAPSLPEPLDIFDTSETVVAAMWQVEDPDEYGCYVATLLTIGDSDPLYSVVTIACNYGDERWEVDEVKSFDNIIPATAEYSTEVGGY